MKSRNGSILAGVVGLCLASSAAVCAAVILTENFNGYSGNQNSTQYQTSLKVAHTGTVPGWTRAGSGTIHAVDRSGSGNWAPMFYRDNVITLAGGIAANDAGVGYTVAFSAAPAVYDSVGQVTGVSDGMLIQVLRGDNSVLAFWVCVPGAWANPPTWQSFSFKYVGDGSGTVKLKVSPLVVDSLDHFAGAIDDLTVTSTGNAPPYVASLSGDFSYAANDDTTTWSYRLDGSPAYLPLLNSTTLNANQLWSTLFSGPPTMWSQGSGYAGIGKNTTTGNKTTSAGGNCNWGPGEVLLHPLNASPGRMVIGWKAPGYMVIEVNYSIGRAMDAGNGVSFLLTKRIGGVDSDLVAMTPVGSFISSSQAGIRVSAGDRLFCRIDNYLGNAGNDVTRAAIQILGTPTAPLITTPPSGGTVAEGCNFTLSVAADCVASYQWHKNNNPISGATSASYTVVDAVSSDAGNYTVVLTNPNGSVSNVPPAVLNFTPRPTGVAVLLSEDSSGYAGNQNALQYQTSLKVATGGTLPAWGKAGAGAIHAVDRTGSGDWAVMLWQDNVITLASGIAANYLGVTYRVDFVANPATYSEGTQATKVTDGMVIDVLRGDNTVLATFTCQPGAWAGNANFAPFNFQYAGDGSGPVRLRVSPLVPASGHFAGAIDNVVVQQVTVPDFRNFNAVSSATLHTAWQYQTANNLGVNSFFAGWTVALGTGCAVELGPGTTGNWAPMFYQNCILSQATGIQSNELGKVYRVAFDVGPAVYGATPPGQATAANDWIRVNILNAGSATVATYSSKPGVWTGTETLHADSFMYAGDGTGVVRLSFAGNDPAAARFQGAVDNVAVALLPGVIPFDLGFTADGTGMAGWTGINGVNNVDGSPDGFSWDVNVLQSVATGSALLGSDTIIAGDYTLTFLNAITPLTATATTKSLTVTAKDTAGNPLSSTTVTMGQGSWNRETLTFTVPIASSSIGRYMVLDFTATIAGHSAGAPWHGYDSITAFVSPKVTQGTMFMLR